MSKSSLLFPDTVGTAEISPCGQYRYRLTREWGDGPTLCMGLLNPSKADADATDSTVTRQVRRATKLGFSRLVIVNAFAFRSTYPEDLRTCSDPVGPDNDAAIIRAAKESDLFIAGWGNDGLYLQRGAAVRKLLRDAGVKLHALKLTDKGEPWHPLYLSYDLVPVLISHT